MTTPINGIQIIEQLQARVTELTKERDAMREVVEAAEAHAKATIEYRLGKITEQDIAGYYNRLVELASQLEKKTVDTDSEKK